MFPQSGQTHNALRNNEFAHTPFKKVIGSCGSKYVVCDLLDKKEVTFASLKYGDFRILAANEKYYQDYDSKLDYIRADDEWEEDYED